MIITGRAFCPEFAARLVRTGTASNAVSITYPLDICAANSRLAFSEGDDVVFIQAPFEEDVASPSLRRAQSVQYATAHPIKIRISPNTYQIDKRQFLNLRAIT